MDVFAFREELVAEYERFSRSFTNIQTEDVSREVDAAYAGGRFWPAPLIQLNPNFEPGGYVDDLIADGTLDSECARIFRIKRADNTFGERLLLHRHQTDAIEIARRGESYVLTTGTGSGKSLAYFIPIVDDVLRRKRAGDACKSIRPHPGALPRFSPAPSMPAPTYAYGGRRQETVIDNGRKCVRRGIARRNAFPWRFGMLDG